MFMAAAVETLFLLPMPLVFPNGELELAKLHMSAGLDFQNRSISYFNGFLLFV